MDSILINDVNEHLKIEIKSNSKRFIILFNKYSNNTAELTFTNINNSILLNEESVSLSETEYNYFIYKLCKILLSWNDTYEGFENIEFQIKINIDKIIKNINGKGIYPPNWNEFINLLALIESEYNKKLLEKTNDIELLDINILSITIDDLINNPDFCTLYIPDKNDNYTISESVPGIQLNNFIIYLEENNIFDKEYLSKYEDIKNKNINDLTYVELITYLTFIIKRESLYPSSLYNDVKDGTLLKILNKIKDVIS